MIDPTPLRPSPEAPDVAAQAFANFNTPDNKEAAVEQVRPYADRGEPWALGLLCFMFTQQGVEAMQAGLPLAKKAARQGMPWVASNYYNHLVGQVAQAPELLDDLLDLTKIASQFSASTVDPVGQGWSLLAQGQPQAAVKIMNVQSTGPLTGQGWKDLVADAKIYLQELAEAANSVNERKSSVDSAADEATTAFSELQAKLETKAGELDLLLDTTAATGIGTRYEEDAKRNAGESKTAWGWGLLILAAAAAIAVLPLVLHYVGQGPSYTKQGLLLAHFGSTAALATVAGVLLARARGRDRARQRATDLATAMGTMIVYSGQIQDPEEKQAFLQTMGPIIFQAQLRFDSPSSGEDSTSIRTMLAALRPGS